MRELQSKLAEAAAVEAEIEAAACKSHGSLTESLSPARACTCGGEATRDEGATVSQPRVHGSVVMEHGAVTDSMEGASSPSYASVDTSVDAELRAYLPLASLRLAAASASEPTAATAAVAAVMFEATTTSAAAAAVATEVAGAAGTAAAALGGSLDGAAVRVCDTAATRVQGSMGAWDAVTLVDRCLIWTRVHPTAN